MIDQHDNAPIGLAFSSLRRLGRLWLSAPWPAVAALASVFLIVKNGVTVVEGNITNFYLPAALALPLPKGYYSGSLGNLLIARAMGVEDSPTWIWLHVGLVVMTVVIGLALAFKTRLASGNIVVLLLLMAPGINVLFGSIGIYDPITVLGALLLILSNRLPWRVLGAFLMALGNPEQALLAAVCLLILTYFDELRSWRTTAILACGIAGGWCLVVQVWLAAGGAGSRLVVLPYLLGQSLTNLFNNPGFWIWSWLGCGWLVVLAVAFSCRGRNRAVAVAALILVPMITTELTADGARVFGIIVLPGFLVAGGWCWQQIKERDVVCQALVGVFVVLLVITPPVTDGWGWLGALVGEPLVNGADSLNEFVTGLG